MNELHDKFDAWISAGADEDPPRDVALHASGCDICLRLAASFDALVAVDPGLAPAPPLRAARVSPLSRAPARLARSAAAALAVVAVVGAGALFGANALRPRSGDEIADATPTPQVAEGVLGAAGGPTQAPSRGAGASASAPASGEASATPIPSPTPRGAAAVPASPLPTIGGGPPPASAMPATPLATPGPTTAPTSAPTAAPTPPPPPPTPSPSPTPTPTPSPTPTATPDDCADGLDNDGDLLIDALDPGCVLDGNEASADPP